ncbi:RNA polymerase sigma-70 factor (ECF subfamily) [Planomicrobium koreense]|uniref:RNA polymerase sigma-70 factor (ECF subfamily) n=1 Tax=Planococcus koreensis TaxID=112331 RepID=A0A7W8CQS6_9BACL|nr:MULTISPECIES: sigma-70 family RNA polymerase sigma factor [Planococcus]MBB5179856.1 RNA polymerase sigma-70 factor (ECF subfamily) [Planococcus koreensis]MDN3451771.1 sigma-70 family RNA polymerase sigma factor [Planococcus sp. APC 3906]
MEDFIARLKRQDEAALNYMIDTYMPFLKGICQHILLKSCGRQAAEECLNDVFMTIWQRAKQFDGDAGDFRKWAGMVAKYKAIDSYRRHMKRLERESVTDDVRTAGISNNTEEMVLDKEARDEVLAGLHSLPEADRDLFLMKYFLGLPNAEIAESLGITVSAVDNRLYRGKRKLAALFGGKERFT